MENPITKHDLVVSPFYIILWKYGNPHICILNVYYIIHQPSTVAHLSPVARHGCQAAAGALPRNTAARGCRGRKSTHCLCVDQLFNYDHVQ